MAKQKYNYKFDPGNTFINPYNFVPNKSTTNFVPDKSTTSRDYEDGYGTHTGVLDCTLKAVTAIIIPDHEEVDVKEIKEAAKGNSEGSKKKKEHKSYKFMRLNNKLAIPASSLRGPIRSVYETLTGSCYATSRRDMVLTGRADPYKPFKPGLLIITLSETGKKLELYEAERYRVTEELLENAKCKYGEHVYFEYKTLKGKNFVTKIAKKDSSKRPNKDGYIYWGEGFSRKKYESIFVFSVDKKNNKICVKRYPETASEVKENNSWGTLKRASENLFETLKIYQDGAINRCQTEENPWYQRITDSGILKKTGCYIPVWYQEVGKSVRLSFASIGRYAYQNTMHDMLREMRPCGSRTSRCPACCMFGLTGEKTGDPGAAGKIRFTDAIAESDYTPKSVNLAELSVPRISYLPFYGNRITDYDTRGATIKGRKYYWHHDESDNGQNGNRGIYEADRPTHLNETMERLDKGVEFKFKVYFDRLTEKQLNELIWTLCIGENNIDGHMCHKIGHAKPFGYGSVKITVDKLRERIFNDNRYYIETIEKNDIVLKNEFEVGTQSYKALMTILDFETIDSNQAKVRYPYVQENGGVSNPDPNDFAAHHWFAEYKKQGNTSAIKNKYPLPGIVPESHQQAGLPSLKAEIAEQSGNTGRTDKKAGAARADNRGNKKGRGHGGPVDKLQGEVSKIIIKNGNRTFIKLKDPEGKELSFTDKESGDFYSLEVGDRVSYNVSYNVNRPGTNGQPTARDVEKIQ